MQVILLATDEQHTLHPLTDNLPAPLLPIVDRPVMVTTVEILARAGHKRLLVSLFERGGQIASYFGDGRRWGVEIKYLTQRQALGSAGALRFAGGLLSESFLVIPGSSIVDLDIEAALAFHRSHGGLATAIMHTTPRASAPTIQVTPDGRVLAAVGASGASSMSLTQAYLFEPGVLAYIPWGQRFDIAEQLLPTLIEAGERVYGYKMSGYWNPLDTISAFQEAQEVYLWSAYRQRVADESVGGPPEQMRFPSLEARQVAPGIWVGRDQSIHPSVKIAAPTYIGHHSWIGREVELGPATVIGANVVIDDEATISASTILSNIYVGRLVNVAEKVVTADTISDVTTSETSRVVDPFLIGPMTNSTSENRGLLGRTATVLVALALIVLLSPLLVLGGLLSLVSTWGLIVGLPRVGERLRDSAGLKTFRLLNFRTRRADGTLTAGGRLMERLELHRLPELFNVVKGDLALVGVKPLATEETAQLTEEWHQRRHERPAGLTGLWYLQTDANSEFDAVIVADVYYSATRTWRGDILCLLRTPKAWLRRALRRSQGEDKGGYLVQAQ